MPIDNNITLTLFQSDEVVGGPAEIQYHVKNVGTTDYWNLLLYSLDNGYNNKCVSVVGSLRRLGGEVRGAIKLDPLGGKTIADLPSTRTFVLVSESNINDYLARKDVTYPVSKYINFLMNIRS